MIDLTVLEADADERTLERQLTSKQILPEVYQARRDRLRDWTRSVPRARGRVRADGARMLRAPDDRSRRN
jgi:hypothetical protein